MNKSLFTQQFFVSVARIGTMPGSMKKATDKIPKLAEVRLVLSFPGYYHAEGALSHICRT